MEQREVGLLQIFERIKAEKTVIGLTTFKRTPTVPVQEKDLPCVFLIEGVDRITKPNSRSPHGYPARRVLEVTVELIVDKKTEIKAMYKKLRSAVFKKLNSNPPVYDPILEDEVFIVENRTEGPTGYGLPDIKGMRLVLDLIYTDGGL